MKIRNKELLLKEIIKILDDNKAKDIVKINLENKSSVADYMIVASGTSSKHIQSISENTIEELKKMGIKGCKVEGRDSDNWKLIDAIDVVVHVFHHEQRKNYDLEKMWADILPTQKIYV
jgi:ribosome-associated protein